VKENIYLIEETAGSLFVNVTCAAICNK